MLSKKEKELLAEIWGRLTPVAEDIGSEALLRMFISYPGTKTYFSHLDISPRSPHLLSHGKRIVLAIAEGAKDISQLTVTLAPLQTLHAYQLRIDPTNFKFQFQYSALVTRNQDRHQTSEQAKISFYFTSSVLMCNLSSVKIIY
ncbi:hemoglobin subunit alpha-D isoform X1 [Notolabrus celidotus]|uniref:hemoglobin subunit alpha-D isoform X1 n=1 Tax=Notolabrus celidotus TaxID=1203425 RepID=UPI00148FD1C6|nr:hemoglobin subunit alpha-D isoform X1 [Notolabrus celidotus]